MPDIAKDELVYQLSSALAPVALLKGYREVRDATKDLDVATFFGHLLHGEVLPGFSDYHDEDLQDDLLNYADQVTENYTDPSNDRLLGAPSLFDWGRFNLPVVLDAWQRGEAAPASVFALAALGVFISQAGYDKDAVPRAFGPNDYRELLEKVRAAFPGAEATESQLVTWYRALIEASDYFANETPEKREELTERLAVEAAGYAQIILSEGVKTALKATFQ